MEDCPTQLLMELCCGNPGTHHIRKGLMIRIYLYKISSADPFEKAGCLLTTTSCSIEDIAKMVGYYNKGYFYKIFKDKYGMTPYQYRRQIWFLL